MTNERKGSPVLRWGRAKVVEVFGADLRSLAAFRIVLGILVLADLAGRTADLYAHYTDRGVLPRGILLQEAMNRWQVSLNLMSGELLLQVLLFDAAALAALTLLIGYRTRLMTVVVWVLLLSIQWRNPLVLNAGDTLLRMLLFWGMFLPLGAYWSVDRALEAAPPRLSMRFLSLATVGLFMQIALVYWFTAALKTGREWRIDGTAIYYALSVDQWTTPIGAYLYNFPTLLEVLTFATLGLEAVGPLLLFCPILTGLVRTGTILAFMSLHLGIWLTMDVGTFPWVSAFCMVCFLPSWFWNKAAKLRTTFPEQPNIVRHVQYTVARPIHAYWSPLRVRSSLTVGVGQSSTKGMTANRDDNQPGSHAVPSRVGAAETPRQGKTQSDAKVVVGNGGEVVRAIRRMQSKIWSPAKATVEPGTRRGAVAMSEPTMLRSSLATNLLAALFLLYVFCWNLTTVSAFTMPERVVPLGSFLGLKQSWNMFAPYPTKNDGWYVIPGSLRSGQQIDLMAAVTNNNFRLGRGLSWEKPQNVAGTYKNKYWRKYLNNIRKERHADQRLYFGRYICREWNARHAGAGQLETLQITYMLEKTLPDYQRATPKKVVLWEHSCF